MRRALICGISGQDGAYLARFLLEKGYEVWGTSREAQASAFGNLSHLGILDRVQTVSMVAETQWLLVAVAVVTVGFATRNLFDYMFAGSVAHLFWILVAAGLCSVRPHISTEAEAGDLSLNEVAQSER